MTFHCAAGTYVRSFSLSFSSFLSSSFIVSSNSLVAGFLYWTWAHTIKASALVLGKLLSGTTWLLSGLLCELGTIDGLKVQVFSTFIYS